MSQNIVTNDIQLEAFVKLIENKSKHDVLQGYRRCNIRHLIAKFGGQTELSKALGYATSTYLTQMVGPSPIRGISETNAREYEEKLGLPVGALDTPVVFTEKDLGLKTDDKNSETDSPAIQPDGRRKYAKIDYAEYKNLRYLEQPKFDLNQFHLPFYAATAEPSINEASILELIDLIESNELSSGKSLKVLRMSIKDLFKKKTLDTEFVSNLIELSK
jgi:hypothetical protein